MNKKFLTLPIVLLMIMTFFTGCSSSRVERGITQLENETSAIKKELTDLESSISGQVQKVNADIQKNNTQLESRVSALDENIRELNTVIQKNGSQFEKEVSTVKEELADLKSSSSDQFHKLNTITQENGGKVRKEIAANKEELDSLKFNLSGHVEKLTANIQKNDTQLENKIAALEGNIQKFNSSIHETVSKKQLYWGIAILVLLLIITSILFFLRHRIIRSGNRLSSELTSSLDTLKNELIQLVTKPAMASEQEPENDNVQSSHEVEPDHSLPIKVCEEIQRMRNRMKHMDQNDQATKVFRKRLESLEEKLIEMKYEIVKLENKPYNEGMTVKASFISNENMREDEEIITKVIKPQINYNNVLIQAAEVEVSQSV